MSRWNHWGYYPPARPKEVKDGIKAKSKRGRIGETWWSGRWIAVLESFNMGARLTRGRSYARRGQVAAMDISEGVVEAKVQGTRSRPYSVTIGLKPLPKKKWDRVTDAMASRAIFAAKLLTGDMPDDIENAFEEAGAPLFPEKKADLRTKCSCPDYANPCKHIAAVYYLLAERFDEDPFLLFVLRGKTKEDVMNAMREKRARAGDDGAGSSAKKGRPAKRAPPRQKDVVGDFWKAGDGLNTCTIRLGTDEVRDAGTGGLGDTTPFAIGGRDLSAVMDEVYRKAREAAVRKAGGEGR